MKKFSPFSMEPDGKEVLPVFELDPSQRRAVSLALAGKTFVLNGPPGTGKSHTIAAILANALAKKKSVLFLAQKTSALEVVRKKIESVNLAPYCLFLEGENEALSAWKKVLSLPEAEKSFFEETNERFLRGLNRANAFFEATHEKEYSFSLFSAVEEYECLAADENKVTFQKSFFTPFKREVYEKCVSLLFLLSSLSEGVKNQKDSLSTYRDYSLVKKELSLLGVQVLGEGIPFEELFSSFKKSFLRGYIESEIAKKLTSFSSYGQNSLLERLRFLKKEREKDAAAEVNFRLHQRVSALIRRPSFEKEYERLLAALYKKEKGVFAYNEFPLFQKATPCVLSGVEVAKKIKRDFDIVIFDEASQILTSDALPLTQKGECVVIVGDEKQLPPTTFFSSAEEVSEGNILEFALSKGVFRHSLTRHYRSESESLIAFSNARFYEGELAVLPSISPKNQVILHEETGIYERKGRKVNEKEALSLCKRIASILSAKDYQGESIGVVTLSLPQKELVERLLNRELKKRGIPLEKKRRANLFISNLEAVQGEERDIILLSLCFGRDESGKLSLRFGPLNHEGGERRLNVALTRAKKRTEVFSSLPEEFLTAPAKSEGVKALQEFLRYLKGERILLKRQPVSPIAESVKKKLVLEGYQADTGVGNEKFFVDIAVRENSLYRLAILLDKKTNTPEEMIFHTEHLLKTGWKVLRLYAADYFSSPEREIKKILSALNDLGVKKKPSVSQIQTKKE